METTRFDGMIEETRNELKEITALLHIAEKSENEYEMKEIFDIIADKFKEDAKLLDMFNYVM